MAQVILAETCATLCIAQEDFGNRSPSLT